jgi:PHD/YefM family antitoxin component YafN of YafNO toxin-antitoxin module
MKQVSISEFKAKCLDLIEEVEKTQQPLLITRPVYFDCQRLIAKC